MLYSLAVWRSPAVPKRSNLEGGIMTAQAAPTTPTTTAPATSNPAPAPAPVQQHYHPQYHPVHQGPSVAQVAGAVLTILLIVALTVAVVFLLMRNPTQSPTSPPSFTKGTVEVTPGWSLDPSQIRKGTKTCSGKLVWNAKSPRCRTLPDGGRDCPFECV